MLRYIAIFQAVHRYTLGLDPEQLKRATCLVYKSQPLENEKLAKDWIAAIEKSYPEKYYIVRHCVISFDENESENVVGMLNNIIKIF